MTHFEDVTFEREDVRLDGSSFDGCTFGPKCRLVFHGGELPAFDQCLVREDTELVLGGSARRTLELLSLLYQAGGDAGAQAVERLFNHIRNGTLQ